MQLLCEKTDDIIGIEAYKFIECTCVTEKVTFRRLLIEILVYLD